MRRKLFTFTAALSLLLCVAACVLWVRSYRIVDICQKHRAGRYRQIVSSGGLLQLELGPTRLPDATTWTSRPGRYINLGPAAKVDWRFHQFMSLSGTTKGVPQRFSQLMAPHWSLALLFGMLPAVWAVVWLRRRRRFGAGRCSACGYDLRATPERCPECGTVSAGAPRPAA
jgi:hypothetical protein